MSKTINVSVLSPLLTENGATEKCIRTLDLQEGQTLYEVLVSQAEFFFHGQEISFSGCMRGTCGKCKVRFHENAPVPGTADRNIFSPDELRQGYRLACQCRPKQDALVEICFEKGRGISILSDSENSLSRLNRLYSEDELGFLADIGTTTVVMELVVMKTGEVIQEYAVLNPQRLFGADVMTRLSAAETQKELLQKSIRDCILKGLFEVVGHINSEYDIILDAHKIPIIAAGNTTMLHFMLGYPTEKLSVYPFLPYSLDEQQMKLEDFNWKSLPGFSAFVGADLFADLCAVSLEKPFLLLDLGTNAEMILFDGKQLFMSAAAAGSAFEGRREGQLFGSELIHEAKVLLEKGYMDKTGLLVEPYFSKGVKTKQGVITKEDLRELQKAKAAVGAGIEILCEKASMRYSDVEKVYLCGGFGHFLNPEEAILIGMLPEAFTGKIESMGNVVLKGIRQYCVNKEKREQILELSKTKMVVNLAGEGVFEEIYIQNLNF